MPAAMPIAIARTMPIARRPRLGSTSMKNAGPIQVSTNASKMTSGLGKNGAEETDDQRPQMTRSRIGRPSA